MKKFVFNLEALLTLREWEEQKAQQEFGRLSAEVVRLEKSVQELDTMKESAFDSWGSVGGSSFRPSDRITLQNQIANLQGQRAEVENSLRSVQEEKSQSMSRLMKAAQNKKAVENLKQQRLEEHRAESFRQEAVEIEDIYNGRRRGGLIS